MNRLAFATLFVITVFSAFAAGFNTGGPGTVWQPLKDSNGNWVGDGNHKKILRVDRGKTTTLRLTGDVTITDRVFVGSSTTDQNTGSANPEPAVLEIFNDTDHDITIRSFIWSNDNGSNVMFSVWENAVLRIHGKPGARIIIDGNGKVTRNYMVNQSNQQFTHHPSDNSGAWDGTRWGLIESTGTLDFEYVTIENVSFQRYDYAEGSTAYCNTEDGDCAVIKLNPWIDPNNQKGNGQYYTQKSTTFRNCIFKNIRNMSNGYASVLTTYGNAGKRSENTRTSCKILFENCEIYDVRQNGHTKKMRYGSEAVDNDDTSAGIIRFRGSWPGDMELKNTKFHNNYSQYDCAGVLWNAIGSGNPGNMPLLTIDGCEFYDNETGKDAGALRLEGNFLFTGAQSKFYNNKADRGGAIQIWGYSGGDPVANGTITQTLNDRVYCHHNTANQGGALIIGYEGFCSLPEGMTINTYLNGCVFENNTANWQGGAICLQKAVLGKWNAKLFLDQATFTGNHVTSTYNGNTSGGGALHAWNFDAEARNGAAGGCTFTNNTSNNFGGAIFAEGTSTLKLDNVTISGNGSDSADKGGAVFGYGGNVFFDFKTINIDQTVAKTSGGAIYLQDGSRCQFDNATITNCTSKGNGGGISMTNKASLDITSGKINNNHATGGSGGGVYASGSNFSMTNGEINSNSASAHGGGVWFTNNVDGASARTFNFGGGSISNNTSGGFGGGVCIYTGSVTGSSFSLTGGSINGNRAEVGGGLYLNGWSTYTVNLFNTNVENNNAYLGGGVLVYNCGLNYKNGFIRHNKANKREGSTAPTTMFHTNHSKYVNNADVVNTDLSGIGGGIYSTNGTVNFDLTDKKFGLYSNLADYGADDIFSTPSSASANATMQLPNPNDMDIIDGFEVPKASLFWAEDYVESDPNFGQKPANAGAGPNKRYRTLLYERSAELANAKFTPGSYTNNYIMAALGYNFVYGIIKKSGMNANETAIIDIYEGELTSTEDHTPLYRVALTADNTGNAEKQILLHPGTWTVVESKWSWTYTGAAESAESNDVRTISGQPAIVRSLIETSPDALRTFSFKNTKKNNITPNSEAIQKNTFK
ncbi:MAG: hypothetical protein ACI31D_02900 [Candidatus Limisoma sp.]